MDKDQKFDKVEFTTANNLYSEVDSDRSRDKNAGNPTAARETGRLSVSELRECAEDLAIVRNKHGFSYGAIKDLLRPMIELEGTSAYMAAEQLRKDPRFEEVPIDKVQPGDIKVFGPAGDRCRHGHTAIQLSGNREASDHLSRNSDPKRFGWATAFRLKER